MPVHSIQPAAVNSLPFTRNAAGTRLTLIDGASKGTGTVSRTKLKSAFETKKRLPDLSCHSRFSTGDS